MGNAQGKKYFEYGMGWLPDYPDFRDYTPDTNKVSPMKAIMKDSPRSMLQKVGVAKIKKKNTLPQTVDVREWCPPIENQNSLGSCTANAGVGLMEYYEKRAFGKYIDASRLFLYKTTRNLLHWTGDTGAYLRTTMSAMVLFGIPPEQYWPYEIDKFETEPNAFCYAFAQNYQALQYIRLDPFNTSRDMLLNRIKSYLAAGLPSIFGFSVYNSINQASGNGKIPFPCPTETRVGGHAIMAVGYDDKMKIENENCKKSTTGALLIRNSWGTSWGEMGYGWLPYDYILQGLAIDWWTLLKSEWIDTGEFKL